MLECFMWVDGLVCNFKYSEVLCFVLLEWYVIYCNVDYWYVGLWWVDGFDCLCGVLKVILLMCVSINVIFLVMIL